MNKENNWTVANKIRKAIITQVNKFWAISKEITFLPFAGCKLEDVIYSKSILSIRQKSNIVFGKWGKDYGDIKEMLKMAESLRRSYVNLIFRTNFIQNPKDQSKLDEVPLALAEIVKEHEKQ